LFGNKIKDMNTQQIEEKVLLALDEIRPFLASDGGDISLVSIEDDKKVKVQLHGACVSCTVNQMTLKTGVEMTIKKYAPQINEVVSVDPV
jgi:Fe-S cluster biogenesis protein NfuA